MMPTTNSDARINFRLSLELKKTIEDAAAEMGQSISDFAISNLVHAARKILHEQQVTRLSERDRQVFAAMLDDESSKPNEALVKAVRRYKKQVG
jgi:uncharacterized protein (DUF1778 family)